MPKALEIAHEYQCPYRQACPHLQGMSTEAKKVSVPAIGEIVSPGNLRVEING